MATYNRTVRDNPWIGGLGSVVHPKQVQFLLHTHTRDVFFGGAGGGGKSQAIWYGALQYVDTPGYAALILRRTYADLAKPGALMDRSREYLHGTGAIWNGTDKQWTFPNGAKIVFGYLQNDADVLQYKSTEFQYIAFDELTDFSEYQFTFLFTRLRGRAIGPVADVPLRMRSASNPGGPGHTWVRTRYVDGKTRDPKRVFIPAKMDDNPSLDTAEYRESLANADPITRGQVERGDWDAVPGGRFLPEWFRYYWTDQGFIHTDGGERFLLKSCSIFQTCDPSASDSASADHFALSTWLISPKSCLLWIGCHHARMEITAQFDTCKRLYRLFKPLYLAVEEVMNMRALAQLLRKSTDPMMAIKSVSPMGLKKLVRATGAMVMMESGRILLPRDDATFPLETVRTQILQFTGADGMPDDIIDTLSYAVQCHTSGGGGPLSPVISGAIPPNSPRGVGSFPVLK